VVKQALLGLVLAMPVFVWAAAKGTDGPRDYTMLIRMQTATPGLLQVFYDRGTGFSEADSVVESLWPSTEFHDYVLRLPPGVYRMFRIDPGTAAGRYTFESITIRDPRGSTEAVPRLAAIQPLFHLRLVDLKDNRLVVETTRGDPVDPQVLWIPRAALRLFEHRPVASVASGLFLLAWAGTLLVVLALRAVLGDASAGMMSLVHGTLGYVSSRPRIAVIACAVAASVAATYPVLFLGRSFVTPHNGASRLLYENPPFLPGTSDTIMEDMRKSDVAATAWAFAPYLRVQRGSLREGEWPLWNRYNAGGRPLWGQGQTFMLDPLHWIALLAPDMTWGLDLKFVAHRMMFALAVGFLALAATGAPIASCAIAASTPFLGVYLYRFNHPGPFALTYVPWIILAWLRLADASVERGRWVVMLALSTALVLFAAPPKEAVIGIAGAWVTGLAAVAIGPGSWRAKRGACVSAFVAGAAALLVTAPQWLVFADTLKQSETIYDQPYALFGTTPHALALFLGPLAPGDILPGIHPLALAALAGALAAPALLLRRKPVLACGVVACALVAIAFGAVPETALVRIPFIRNIGHVHDVFLAAAMPMLLVVCAFGLDALSQGGPTRVSIASAIVLIAAAPIVYKVSVAEPSGFAAFASLAALSLAAVLPLMIAPRVNAGAAGAGLMGAIAAAVFLVIPSGLHTDTPLSSINALLFQPRPRAPLDDRPPAVQAIQNAGRPARTAGVDWMLFPGSQGLYGLEGVGGDDALQLPRYERLADAAGMWRSWFYFLRVPAADLPRLSPFLDLMNVDYLLTEPTAHLVGAGTEETPAGDRLTIVHRPSAWPRAFFVTHISRYSGLPDLLAQVTASTGPLAAVESTDAGAALALTGRADAGHTGRTIAATRYVLTTNTTAFHLETQSGGVAVLTEAYLPDDFVVTLNGQPAPYFRVNHAFKGVVIPSSGDWDVRFEYRPARWRLSLMLAVAGGTLLLAIAVGLRRAMPGRTEAWPAGMIRSPVRHRERLQSAREHRSRSRRRESARGDSRGYRTVPWHARHDRSNGARLVVGGHDNRQFHQRDAGAIMPACWS
jgi:hypothetical protein